MDHHPLNAYEKVIYNDLNGYAIVPRVLVFRDSMQLDVQAWIDRLKPDAGTPLAVFLSAEHPEADISGFFELSRRWDQSESQPKIELDSERYPTQRCDTQWRAEYVFSSVVTIENGGLFYAGSDWGFLWSRAYLCRFQGPFQNPDLLERQLLVLS